MPNRSTFKSNGEYLKWYKDYRNENREKIREYHKKYNREYRKEHGYLNEKKWKMANKEKYNAHMLLNYAVRTGIVKKDECCEVCGNKNIQGHHDDYSKPLEVKWLCPLCHKKQHLSTA